MNHYDEHAIARLILRGEAASDERQAFLLHLEECHSCRELHEELRSFYSSSLEKRSALTRPARQTAMELIRRWESGRSAVGVPNGQGGMVLRSWRFLKRRPLATAGVGVSAVGLLVYSILGTPFWHDSNPIRLVTVDETRSLEVYNSSNDRLWTVAWRSTGRYANPIGFGRVTLSGMADINGDGRNEVASVIPFEKSSTVEEWATLRIFSAESDLLVRRSLGREAQYRDMYVEPTFLPRSLMISRLEGEAPSIIVAITHRHSPAVVLRLDRHGNTVGEYWHYGHLAGITQTSLGTSGQQSLVICGLNDDIHRGTIIVLDPTRLVGTTQASMTPGFSFQRSAAEMACIQLPRAPFEEDATRGEAGFVYNETDSTISISYLRGGSTLLFDYVLDRSLRLRHITPTDDARISLDKWKRDANWPDYSMDSMLSQMKDSVLYWTGSAWTSIPTFIQDDLREEE